MTKAPTPTENQKAKWQHETSPKTSITQRLRTDVLRSVGVTTTIKLVWSSGFLDRQPSQWPGKQLGYVLLTYTPLTKCVCVWGGGGGILLQVTCKSWKKKLKRVVPNFTWTPNIAEIYNTWRQPKNRTKRNGTTTAMHPFIDETVRSLESKHFFPDHMAWSSVVIIIKALSLPPLTVDPQCCPLSV